MAYEGWNISEEDRESLREADAELGRCLYVLELASWGVLRETYYGYAKVPLCNDGVDY